MPSDTKRRSARRRAYRRLLRARVARAAEVALAHLVIVRNRARRAQLGVATITNTSTRPADRPETLPADSLRSAHAVAVRARPRRTDRLSSRLRRAPTMPPLHRHRLAPRRRTHPLRHRGVHNPRRLARTVRARALANEDLVRRRRRRGSEEGLCGLRGLRGLQRMHRVQRARRARRRERRRERRRAQGMHRPRVRERLHRDGRGRQLHGGTRSGGGRHRRLWCERKRRRREREGAGCRRDVSRPWLHRRLRGSGFWREPEHEISLRKRRPSTICMHAVLRSLKHCKLFARFRTRWP